jgi:predicted lipid-binding transport protein (Tim44 family)
MEELIARLSATLGIEAETARLAVGHVLAFFRKEFPDGPAAELIGKLPGAEEAIAAAEAAPPAADGGLLGGLLGGLGGLIGGSKGDLMALAGRLSGAGLSLDQSQALAKEFFDHARGVVGEAKVREITDQVPGLSQYL